MEAAGALLWIVAIALAALLAGSAWIRSGGLPEHSERRYVLVSWATLPAVLPLLLATSPSGPEMPAPLVLLALLRIVAGVPLALLGLFLAIAAWRRGRSLATLLATTLANVAPMLVIAIYNLGR